MTFDLSTMLSVGGIAVVAGFWQQARALFVQVRSLFVVSIKFDEYSQCFLIPALTKTNTLPSSSKQYSSQFEWVRSKKRTQLVCLEAPKMAVFWSGIFPIFYTIEKDTITLTSVRPFDLEKFVTEALVAFNDHNKRDDSRFRVVKFVGDTNKIGRSLEVNSATSVEPIRAYGRKALGLSEEDIGQPISGKGAFYGLSYPPEVKAVLVEFDEVLASREWFEEREIPWRLGWLAYGVPGSGKSRLARAMAQHANMPLYVFDIATMTNEEFGNYWQQASSDTPCMVVIEDIDGVFDGRKNISGKEDGMTFDCLLNCMSGVSQSSGVFLYITTNKLDKIDEAIGIPKNGVSSRPGRIDRTIPFYALPEENRREIASRILDRWPELVEKVVADTDGFTGAQITDVCVQKALAFFWSEKRKTEKQKCLT